MMYIIENDVKCFACKVSLYFFFLFLFQKKTCLYKLLKKQDVIIFDGRFTVK